MALTYFQNLIETQAPKAGVTVHTDHLPAVGEQSLSNKGQLSAWKIHETADLNLIVQILHKKGSTMEVGDSLSRIERLGAVMYNLQLPYLFDKLLQCRVSAEKDTTMAARIAQ